jgi:hypothetical protein
MKLLVLDAQKHEQLIEIELPIRRAYEGHHMNLIADANGVEHYFALDGHYDGWGTLMVEPAPPDAAHAEVIDALESALSSLELEYGECEGEHCNVDPCTRHKIRRCLALLKGE